MSPFLPVLALFALAIGLVAAGYALSTALGAARPEVSGPFLSGGTPLQHAVSRFHVRWYVVTLLFLAFDMEMVFMYPWAVVVAELGAKAVVEMGVFLALLFVGVLYVWRERGLRWT